MAIKKFKIEASEQAKKLAKKPVKASDGEWDKAVISFIDTIPELPEQGKVISKTYKGWPIVIVGLGNGKCLYHSYLQKANAASDIQFIRGLIKRGDAPEKAVENLGFKTYTRGDVEGACGGKKKSIKSAETGKSIVNDIKNYIADFYDTNYGIPVDFSDMANIPISFAYEGKTDKLLAQVVIDIVNAEIAYVENGKRKTLKQFTDLDDLWNFMQKHSFDDYEAMLVGTSDIKAAAGKKPVKSVARKPARKTVKASTEYLESELADKTKYKLIKDAYNENNLTIVKHGDSFYFERTPSEKVANLAIKEIKRIYPELTYIGDIKASLKSSKRSRSVKATKKDDMNKEAHKWYNISLTKDEYAKFRKFLKENGYKYEPSEEGQNTYVKVYLTKADADKVNKFLDSMDDVESACGGKKSKKTVKAETYKRTSDARPYKDRKYWYFTTHGIGPGTIPRDLKILDVQEGQNKKGTWGDFVLLDGVLNYDELKKYDMIELPPENPNTYGIFLGDDAEPIQIFEYKEDALDALDEMRQAEDYGKDFRFGKVRKINSSVTSKKKTVKASAAAKRRAKQKVTASMPDLEDIVMYFDHKKIYEGDGSGLTAAVEELCKDDEIKAKFVEWCNQFGDPIAFESGDAHDTAFAFAWLVDTIRYEELDKFYIDGDGILDFEIFNKSDEVTGATKPVICSEDGPLCVCDSCLAGIESHEGRQVIYDEIYSDADYGEPPLICDWCGDEVEKLYQITPGERIESAEQSVKASKYYEITDHNNNEVGRSDLEDEARELATKLLKENDEDHYDIWWVDTDPDSTDDTSYIDTVYADKPFSVEGYYEANFRGLSDSDTFYELRDALEYAQELLSKGLSVRMECENAGGRVEITPDEYDEFVQTSDGALFEDMPEVAEWLHQVQVERMDSNQEPWLDNWQYNTDIGMSVTAMNSLDMTAGTDIPKGWNLYGYDLNGEDVESSYVTFQGDVEKEIRKLFENSEIDTIDLYKVVDEYGTSDYFDTFTRDDINASAGVKAALGNKNKTDYASNPIYELDKYVKDLAEGVAAAAGITLTYQVSDEAITFIDGDGTAVFIQPISEITPEPDDLEDDIQQLVSAIQYEDMDNPEYWPTDTTEDDPDYATRAVQMSVDDELEPVMGEGEDIGYGIDSYGGTIDESTVWELFRIADTEILPNTELAKIDPYVSIDEDSWDFYFGGVSNTGMMGVVKFYIHFKLTSDNIDLNEYVLPDAKLYPDFNYYKASLDFDIYTENGKVTDVVLESADIYKSDNSYDDHFSGKFGEAFNTEALENYIEKLAAPAAEEIYNAVSNL